MNRPLAITDLETSGDIPGMHEILEIGLVVCDPKTFEVIDTLNIKARPEHIETADPAALACNGYHPENWQNTVSLEEALKAYLNRTQEAIFCAYNVSFDWAFVNEALWRLGLPNPMSTKENHDRLDVLTLAWEKGLKRGTNLSLKSACQMFGIPPEPEPHSALNGAMTAYKLFKTLEMKEGKTE